MAYRFNSIHRLSIPVLCCFLCTVTISAQAAPVAPDAGQTSRELQQAPDLAMPESTDPVQVDEPSPAKTTNGGMRFDVSAIRVTGSSVFQAGELENLVADIAGAGRTLADLEAGAARITAHYRSHGYLVARAYLPAQDIKDGVVTIDVLEGRIGEKRIDNQSRLSDDQVGTYLGNISSNEVLQARTADRALLLLNDTPGVGEAKAALQPGASVGTSDLILELTPSAPYTANLLLDNHGNRYTGENRLGATLAFNSPSRNGDQITLNLLTTDQHLTYAKAAYQLPLGGSGLRLGASYSATRYRLGKEFSGLQAHGSASSASVYAMYPFIRSQTSNLSGTFSWESKKLKDGTDVPVTSSDRLVRLTSAGLAGNHRDTWGGAGITSFDLSWASGKLEMDAVSLAVDQASAKTNGTFTRLNYTLKRLQRLGAGNTLSLKLSGQKAGKNLNTSEKFYLGGVSTIRAYPQGEASGDDGFLANLELRHDVAPQLQALLFYDAGSVSINRNPYVTGADNTRSLAGAGVGMEAMLVGIELKASLAWRTAGGEPQSVPSTRGPRLWLQAGKQF